MKLGLHPDELAAGDVLYAPNFDHTGAPAAIRIDYVNKVALPNYAEVDVTVLSGPLVGCDRYGYEPHFNHRHIVAVHRGEPTGLGGEMTGSDVTSGVGVTGIVEEVLASPSGSGCTCLRYSVRAGDQVHVIERA